MNRAMARRLIQPAYFYFSRRTYPSPPPLYHTTTSDASQAFQMLNFCYESVTKLLQKCYGPRSCGGALSHKASLWSRRVLILQGATSCKLEAAKAGTPSLPHRRAPQAGSWKPYTHPSWKKSEPPIFGSRRAAIFRMQ